MKWNFLQSGSNSLCVFFSLFLRSYTSLVQSLHQRNIRYWGTVKEGRVQWGWGRLEAWPDNKKTMNVIRWDAGAPWSLCTQLAAWERRGERGLAGHNNCVRRGQELGNSGKLFLLDYCEHKGGDQILTLTRIIIFRATRSGWKRQYEME